MAKIELAQAVHRDPKLSLARNIGFNLLGHVAPLLAAVFLVPGLIENLGPVRFGFLSLAWALVGYFSLFDLGFGRALSRLVAEQGSAIERNSLAATCKSTLSSTFLMGAVVGCVVFVNADWLCINLLHIPGQVHIEASTSLRILSMSLPMVTITAALRGILEGGKFFGWVNFIRVPLGVLTFAGPAVVAAHSPDLIALAWVLSGLRIVTMLAHWFVAKRLFPQLIEVGIPKLKFIGDLVEYGSWVTLSNILGPIIVYADRFMIASIAGVAAVGFYTAPYEVVTRLWVFPAAISATLFPSFVVGDKSSNSRLYGGAIKIIALLIMPVALAGIVFAQEWLHLWIGDTFSRESGWTARILAIGIVANCFAYIPFALLQARGRADLPAKLHMTELPVYLFLLWISITHWGIVGAATAWALRNTIDAVALFWLCRSQTLVANPVSWPTIVLVAILLFAGLMSALFDMPLAVKSISLIVAIALFMKLFWSFVFDNGERAWAINLISRNKGGE